LGATDCLRYNAYRKMIAVKMAFVIFGVSVGIKEQFWGTPSWLPACSD